MTASKDPQETAAGVKRPLRDGIDTAREQVGAAAHTAREGLDHAREAAADSLAAGREHAADAYQAAREKARAAAGSAAETIETNPLAAVLGGAALGLLAGVLLPRTERETQAFGAIGARLQEAAREAAGAARSAGQQQLADAGISRDRAGETVRSLIEAVLGAAGTAATAAVDSARKSGANAADATKR